VGCYIWYSEDSTVNRGIQRHRIANFPNYVTLSGDLNSLASAILVSYSPYDVTYDVIGNPHYSSFYPYVVVGLGLEVTINHQPAPIFPLTHLYGVIMTP